MSESFFMGIAGEIVARMLIRLWFIAPVAAVIFAWLKRKFSSVKPDWPSTIILSLGGTAAVCVIYLVAVIAIAAQPISAQELEKHLVEWLEESDYDWTQQRDSEADFSYATYPDGVSRTTPVNIIFDQDRHEDALMYVVALELNETQRRLINHADLAKRRQVRYEITRELNRYGSKYEFVAFMDQTPANDLDIEYTQVRFTYEAPLRELTRLRLVHQTRELVRAAFLVRQSFAGLERLL